MRLNSWMGPMSDVSFNLIFQPDIMFNYTSALCQLARLINSVCALLSCARETWKYTILLTTTTALHFVLLPLSPISSRLLIVLVRYFGRRALRTTYINNVSNAVGCVTPISWLDWITTLIIWFVVAFVVVSCQLSLCHWPWIFAESEMENECCDERVSSLFLDLCADASFTLQKAYLRND